ncbi:unnamed protein product [Miscanthus lutarioriparius]|uniref:Uncharacterized protein n=1 Tax=Miscanthus lutarioriparius TaxID=422564 RepID=A0A811NYY1_9POAL|nr:unnamed protein product [Miscanthus lutarioriparius]
MGRTGAAASASSRRGATATVDQAASAKPRTPPQPAPNSAMDAVATSVWRSRPMPSPPVCGARGLERRAEDAVRGRQPRAWKPPQGRTRAPSPQRPSAGIHSRPGMRVPLPIEHCHRMAGHASAAGQRGTELVRRSIS